MDGLDSSLNIASSKTLCYTFCTIKDANYTNFSHLHKMSFHGKTAFIIAVQS